VDPHERPLARYAVPRSLVRRQGLSRCDDLANATRKRRGLGSGAKAALTNQMRCPATSWTLFAPPPMMFGAWNSPRIPVRPRSGETAARLLAPRIWLRRWREREHACWRHGSGAGASADTLAGAAGLGSGAQIASLPGVPHTPPYHPPGVQARASVVFIRAGTSPRRCAARDEIITAPDRMPRRRRI
jgi:hypothetical protein